MSTPLLTTKLYMPSVGAKLVPRPHLVQQLEEGLYLGCRLTLVETGVAEEHEILALFHQLWGVRGQQDDAALEQMRTIQTNLHKQFAPCLPA